MKKPYTEKDIHTICKMLITMTPTEVAAKLGIPRSTVYNIKAKRDWRYVVDEYVDRWNEKQ